MSAFEKFSNRNLILAQYLERIAGCHLTGALDRLGRFSPDVRRLLAAQEKLLSAAEQVFEKLEAGVDATALQTA